MLLIVVHYCNFPKYIWFQHEFPNFQVDVYVLVLENDGSVLAAAINCAGLALADASVPMYDLVSAATMVCNCQNRLIMSLYMLNYKVCLF